MLRIILGAAPLGGMRWCAIVLFLFLPLTYAASDPSTGGIDQYFNNCLDGTLENGSPNVNNSAAHGVTNWTACMLIYCERHRGAEGCEWYEEIIAGGGTNTAQYFQELKSFIAIEQLEFMRDKVLQQVTPAPEAGQTRYSGYKLARIEPYVQQSLRQRDWQLYVWDMFNPGSYTASNFVQEHFRNYCSFFEARYPGVQHYCGNDKTPLPYDFMASSLLGKTVIKPKMRQYLYSQSNGFAAPRYFFVDEDEKDAFEAQYPGAVQVEDGSYNVDMQKAAVTYIRNITSGVPLGMLPDDKLFFSKSTFIYDKKNGVPYLRAKMNMTTILSLARQSLLRMYADRLPNETVAKTMSTISDESFKTSKLGLIEYETKRRFENGDWYQKMNKLPKEAIMREIANMLALQSNINFRIMSHLERTEALMAAMLSYNVNTSVKEAARAAVSAAG